MPHTITLICNPANTVLDTSLISDLSDALEREGGQIGRLEWLDGPIAADLECAGLQADMIEDILRDNPLGQKSEQTPFGLIRVELNS